MPIKLGITGGIGSGKSMICQILELLNIPVYYADDRAKWLMNTDATLQSSILELFGSNAIENGSINRSYIAKKVFHDDSLLKKLNDLIHPAVGQDFDHWVQNQEADIVAKEAALLFETGGNRSLTQTWLVTCPEDIRIRRILDRDPHRTKEDVESIIRKQWPENKKKKLADRILVNDESQLVIPQVLQAVADLHNLKSAS